METHLTFEIFDDVARKEMHAVRPDRMVFIGVDLGQRGSHSAIVVLERFEEWPTEFADVLRGERSEAAVCGAAGGADGVGDTLPRRGGAVEASGGAGDGDEGSVCGGGR